MKLKVPDDGEYVARPNVQALSPNKLVTTNIVVTIIPLTTIVVIINITVTIIIITATVVAGLSGVSSGSQGHRCGVIRLDVLVVGVAGRRWERGMGTGGGRVRVEVGVGEGRERRGRGEGDVRVIIYPSVHPRTRSNFVLTLGTPFQLGSNFEVLLERRSNAQFSFIERTWV